MLRAVQVSVSNNAVSNIARTLSGAICTCVSSFVLSLGVLSSQLGLHTCLPPTCIVAQSKAIFLALFPDTYTMLFVAGTTNCTL